ncbi:MAG: hypothetical protein V1672_00880 [Candidatus Diapherotrites archaeon]
MNISYLMLALGLTLLLAGCTQTTSDSAIKYVCADGTTTVTDPTLCPATTATTKELTQEEKDLEVCSGMPSTQAFPFEDSCIMGIAGKYENASICKEVSRDQRTNCYVLVAELKNDADICSEAGTDADRCYEQYARDKKDALICDKISEINYRENCYSNLASELLDPELCNEIKSISMKDSCYFNMAMRLGDSSYCDKITNESQKQNCLQNIQNTGGGYSQIPVKPIQ